MKKMIAIAAAALLAMPAAALAADGLIGQCADCHTMHNSQAGHPVALQYGKAEPDGTRNQNLLKLDCLACHAQDPTGPKIAVMDGGSAIPQVFKATDGDDLAAGNFNYITTGGDRKGHNVVDLFGAGDGSMESHYGEPPGKYYAHAHGPYFSDVTVTLNPDGTVASEVIDSSFAKFTCAGAAGCHGTRSQMLSGYTDTTTNKYVATKRRGIAAVSGAHHNSFDGAKDAAQVEKEVHDGAKVAGSYRFIKGLKGTGNIDARWQNVDSSSHNEYYGVAKKPDDATVVGNSTGCNACHVPGTYDATNNYNASSARMALDSSLRVPNQSMSGFCITCHGNFHSSSFETGLADNDRFQANGKSGAFLRHPSDYKMPSTGEYANYTVYDITAPVARPTLYAAAESSINHDADMVMCLSCHQAHATPNDGMLRFDYNTQTALISAGTFSSIADAQAEGGCLACHTTKGVLPQNR